MTIWHLYPPIEATSPVLALATGRGQVWAGGVGGVDSYRDGQWQSLGGRLPLTSVTALSFAGGWLMAGGADGLARSADGGRHWEKAQIAGPIYPVSALVTSPDFQHNGCALAATLGGGVLRSEDAGHTWKPSDFGLQAFEVLALAWSPNDSVLAATTDGIYRSPNGGRAWRPTQGCEWESVTALALLPDGALAALETGGLLRSQDGGQTWSPLTVHDPAADPLQALQVLALATIDAQTWLVSTMQRGVLYTRNAGATWENLCPECALTFAGTGQTLYAGIEDGLIAIADMQISRLPAPSLHDLRALVIVEGNPWVYGLHSGLWAWRGKQWEAVAQEAVPLTALAIAPDGGILLSGAAGLLRSGDAGTSWDVIMPGELGMFAYLTFRPDGSCWAGSADGRRLFRTRDSGATWELLTAPFGILPLAALQATAGLLMAATYDERTHVAELWYSVDDGDSWTRGAQATTPWPIVATAAQPPLLTLGGLMFVLEPDGMWVQRVVGDGAGVRRLVSSGQMLLALTPNDLLHSTDRGVTWTAVPDMPPAHTILDLALDGDVLYLLLKDGQVQRANIA